MNVSSLRLQLTTVIIAVVAMLGLIVPSAVIGQSEPLACTGAGGTPTTQADGTGGCDFGPGSVRITGEDSLFRTITNMLLFITGAIAVIFLVINGIRLVVSNGDPQAVQTARMGILYSVVGVVVAFMAFAILNFVIFEIANPEPDPPDVEPGGRAPAVIERHYS